MSHAPRECEIVAKTGKHSWSGWDTVELANSVGDRVFEFQRRCSWCGAIDAQRGAVVPVEPREFRYFAKVQPVNEEPDS